MNETRATDRLNRKLAPGNVVLVFMTVTYRYASLFHKIGEYIITCVEYRDQGNTCILELSELYGKSKMAATGTLKDDKFVFDYSFYKLAEYPANL